VRKTTDVAVELEEFEHVLQALVGKTLWEVVAGESTGTAVLLNFGRKIPAQEIDRNPTPVAQEKYVGEMSLMVWCSWRIEAELGKLLCGCGDLHNEGGPMLTGLQQLNGDTVRQATVDSFLDLLIAFDSGRQLRLFCDRNRDGVGYGCYCLFIVRERAEVCYAVLNGGIVRERELPSGREE